MILSEENNYQTEKADQFEGKHSGMPALCATSTPPFITKIKNCILITDNGDPAHNEQCTAHYDIQGISGKLSRHYSEKVLIKYIEDKNSKLYSISTISGLIKQIMFALHLGCSPVYVYLPENQEEDEELSGNLKELSLKLYDQAIMIARVSDSPIPSTLPLARIRCLTDKPKVAVTVRTFSADNVLVGQLDKLCPGAKLNRSSDKLDDAGLVEFLKDADGTIVGMENINMNVLDKLPFLRAVSKYGVGIDNIDFDGTRNHKVHVHYKKGLNSNSVAELTIAFALTMIRNVNQSMSGYRNKKWAKLPGRELSEMTIGIIGYGNIGKIICDKLITLGCGRVLVNDILDSEVPKNAEFVPLEKLITESDVISLHISMSEKNKHFVNEPFISKMKKGSYIINTSRGDVMDEDALIEALKSGQLAGAALDVYADEPVTNPSLIEAPNLITTCHIGGSSNKAIKNMGFSAIEGIKNIFSL